MRWDKRAGTNGEGKRVEEFAGWPGGMTEKDNTGFKDDTGKRKYSIHTAAMRWPTVCPAGVSQVVFFSRD